MGAGRTRGGGEAVPQAVFPAHPGEWGHVNRGPDSQGFTARSDERPIDLRFRRCPASPEARLLAGEEGPPSLAMAASSVAILARRVGVGGVHRVLQVLEGGDDRDDLAGRDAGCREGGREIARWWFCCGVQELPLFQQLARRSTPVLLVAKASAPEALIRSKAFHIVCTGFIGSTPFFRGSLSTHAG